MTVLISTGSPASKAALEWQSGPEVGDHYEHWKLPWAGVEDDTYVFLLKAPLPVFLGQATFVQSYQATDEEAGGETWAVEMGETLNYRRAVTLEEVMQALPELPGLNRAKAVQEPEATRLLAVLRDLAEQPTPPLAPFTALEGEGSVTQVKRRKRNAVLRAKKLQAGTRCEACAQDVAGNGGGRGRRAIHVHHNTQLSLASEPVATTLDDLAVVCAVCHSMLHADPNLVLPVAQLRRILQQEAAENGLRIHTEVTRTNDALRRSPVELRLADSSDAIWLAPPRGRWARSHLAVRAHNQRLRLRPGSAIDQLRRLG